MVENIVMAILTTALLYIGRCWGRQEPVKQDIKFSVHDIFPEKPEPPFSQSDFEHLKRTGRATVMRRGRQ